LNAGGTPAGCGLHCRPEEPEGAADFLKIDDNKTFDIDEFFDTSTSSDVAYDE
jgi:hypothetical protein